MKLYILEKEQFVKIPRDKIFDFFARPENLAKITPKKLGFEILTPPPISMRPGTLIDYTIKVAGIRQRWTTLITEYEPPVRFIDVQLRGPYAFWHHEHTFEKRDDGTLIKDKVIYSLPFGILGSVAHALFVKGQLNRIFNYRSKIIAEEFGGETERAGYRG